jgi:hypothetical protein
VARCYARASPRRAELPDPGAGVPFLYILFLLGNISMCCNGKIKIFVFFLHVHGALPIRRWATASSTVLL